MTRCTIAIINIIIPFSCGLVLLCLSWQVIILRLMSAGALEVKVVVVAIIIFSSVCFLELCLDSLVPSFAASCRNNTNKYLEAGPQRIGSKYKKVIYVEYEDGTFKKHKVANQHDTGILGPVLKGEVGDQFTVRKKELLDFGQMGWNGKVGSFLTAFPRFLFIAVV